MRAYRTFNQHDEAEYAGTLAGARQLAQDTVKFYGKDWRDTVIEEIEFATDKDSIIAILNGRTVFAEAKVVSTYGFKSSRLGIERVKEGAS